MQIYNKNLSILKNTKKISCEKSHLKSYLKANRSN
jgi:hypothetical protein